MLLLLAALAGATSPSPVAPDLVLRNVRILDAVGDRTVESVVVDQGRITHIGPFDGRGRREVDLTGHTVTPGWVDSHVHIASVPGSLYREPLNDARFESATRDHLRAYVANGVTTIVDVGMPATQAMALDAIMESEPVAPRLVFVGPFLSPADGYPSVAAPQIPGLVTPDDVVPTIEAFDVDTFGVKVTWEHGFTKSTWPTHTEEMAAVIAREAALRGKEVWVHAQTEDTQLSAMAVNPDVFVHPTAHPPSRRHIELLREHDIAVMSTISAVDFQLGAWELERLEHPMVRLTVPANELETAGDPVWNDQSNRDTVEVLMPNSPGFIKGLARTTFLRPIYRARRASIGRSVRRLVENDIPVLMGSDSGNWPVFLHGFHGPTSTRELVLMRDAGLTPQQVIRAATLEPAMVLELEDEIGTIEVGKRAEMVVFDADLLTDFDVVRTPTYVVLQGEMRTPAEWMTQDLVASR